MLIDTHCHINIMIKNTFDTVLLPDDFQLAQEIILAAYHAQVTPILNVGTSIIESYNSVALAKQFPDHIAAAVGIHPNDLTHTWHNDIQELNKLLTKEKQYSKAIGECGLDFHYPGYDKQRQYSGFKAHIELALEHDLPLVIHTRDAHDEVLKVLQSFQDTKLRGVIHCFSENLAFARDALALQFVLGIGGTITYPKNHELRTAVQTIGLEHIILETDAPYLPPQILRGTKNHPKNITLIAQYIAQLLEQDFTTVATHTTKTAQRLFNFNTQTYPS
jgi:TatD DNase family protein